VDRVVAIIRIGICPGLTPEQCRIYKDEHIRHSEFFYRRDVVFVVADRTSRSAEFVTSSELSCLLNMLYNYANRVL